jgi:hypothetical protein
MGTWSGSRRGSRRARARAGTGDIPAPGTETTQDGGSDRGTGSDAGGQPAARKAYSLSLMMRCRWPVLPFPCRCPRVTAMELTGRASFPAVTTAFFSLSESDTATTPCRGFTRRG